MTVKDTPSQVKQNQQREVKRMEFLGNLPVSRKLLIYGISLGIPLLGVLGYQTWNAYRTYKQAQHAVQVNNNYNKIVQIQQALRAIDGYSAKDIKSDYKNWTMRVNDLTVELDNRLKEINIPEASNLTVSLRSKAVNYLKNIESGSISTDELSHLNQDMQQNELSKLFIALGQNAQVAGSATPEVMDLIYYTSRNLPVALPEFGRVYNSPSFIAYQAATQQKGNLTDSQKTLLVPQMAEARHSWNKVVADYKVLADRYPEFKNYVDASLNAASRDTNKSLDLTDRTLKGSHIDINVSAYNKSFTDYLNTQYIFFNKTVDYLQNKLTNQENLAKNMLIALLLATLALIGFVIFLASRISRAISDPLQRLTSASYRLSAGDFSTKVPITSNDELGTLSRSFNSATEQLQANELRAQQEREEAARLQGNIGEFLDVTMDIAEGDLTKRGKVTEDVLGNVVDSINLMTEELGVVLKDVQSASNSVTGGSRAMLATTEQINQGTQLTASEAERVAQQVRELTAAIRNMASNAQTSAETARQALLASQQGQEAVTGTLAGMQNVRREVQDISKRVKGLGDRSLEIQEIVDTIGQIARQTNLLALNAAIEAAGAGEAGGRFTIVADEVRKLADTSGQATARIATLIKNVQSEIQDVVVRVEEGTREVEQGYRVAGTAGERLREIGTLSERSAQLAEQISEATQEQVRGIEQMGQAVAQINNIAQDSAQSVEEGRAAAEQLQQLATQLNSSLSRFRLPG